IEHHLQIESRTTDDLEHIGGGGLLLERLTQFVEQAGVLNGDDRLSGEVLYKIDFLSTERPHLLPVNDDTADQLIILEHGHGNCGSRVAERNRGSLRLLRRVVGTVGHLLCQQDTLKQSSWLGQERTTLL